MDRTVIKPRILESKIIEFVDRPLESFGCGCGCGCGCDE
jgi:hypothetical protein